MKNSMEERLTAFRELLEIMNELREKCPWDRKQTLESLRSLTIEETYELAEAITRQDLQDICKELGDLMLHIVFYAKIAEEKKAFDIADVMQSLNQKLVYRHPHIYGDVVVKDDRDVKKNWEELKMREGKKVLSGVPEGLPSMIKASRIQEKARAVGFDWDKRYQIWDKVCEEIEELKDEVESGDKEKTEQEFGDLFFSLINAARLYGIDPETALEKTNKKFIQRFNYLEEQTLLKGRSLKDMTLGEMDKIWEEAKDGNSKF